MKTLTYEYRDYYDDLDNVIYYMNNLKDKLFGNKYLNREEKDLLLEALNVCLKLYQSK